MSESNANAPPVTETAPKATAPGRDRGSCNYKQAILLKVIDAILPGGQVAWPKVAERYHVLSGELLARQPEDVKRYFMEKCCDKGKKPTGTSGPSPTIEKAQRIYRKILSKNSMRGWFWLFDIRFWFGYGR
jgi:hypothetical protein